MFKKGLGFRFFGVAVLICVAGGLVLAQAAAAPPTIGKCRIFPSNNPWNLDVSAYPVHPNSENFIASIGAEKTLHPDLGGGGRYGIPYEVVGADQPLVPVEIIWYAEDSEPGPFPIPLDARIENDGEGDAHILVLEEDNCMLYELYAAARSGNGFQAGSAAVFDLSSNKLRSDDWPTPISETYGLTSADAAGLPILPGLVRYDDVKAGAVNHAIRFTVNRTQRAWIYPATHQAGSTDDENAPPMGLRLRLKSDFDLSGYSGDARVILEAMKTYGIILADNGGDWFFQGARDDRWDDDDLRQIKSVPGSAFEVVDTSSMEALVRSGAEYEQVNTGGESSDPVAEAGPFLDVNLSHPQVAAIEYVKAQGVVEGYADGTFKPSQTINRAEFTKMIIAAAFGYDPEKDESSHDIFSLSGLIFSDLKSGEWYNPYLRKAVGEGVIGGYPDGTFKPAAKINFAEASKIIVLGYGYNVGGGEVWYKPFTDVIESRKARPASVRSYDQQITRGEMAEIIYRMSL